MEESKQIETAALGRPFRLGMLYDARADKLITGLALWDPKTTRDMTTESSQVDTKFKILASDSTETKSSLLDINASLKVSFLGGLVEVAGSAEYLNDKKKSRNQSRLTLHYRSTTKFKKLSIVKKPQFTDVIKNGMATHVVTAILYGANTFFVFDSEKVDSSSATNIEAGAEALIKKMPKVDVEGKIDIKLTEEEKALANKFSCKFYGDIRIPGNPRSFEAALKAYEELPKLLGENGQEGVPLTVYLTPLKFFDQEAAGVVSEISFGLVGKAQDALDKLNEIKARCNDCLDESVVKKFPQIREKLQVFQERCDYYVKKLQREMAKKVPSIRGGEEDETSAKQLFDDREQSPFSDEKLNKWLDHKEREINIIKSCVDATKGTKIVLSQSELDREVLASGVEDALCFVFTSLESADPYIDAMANYLDFPVSGSAHEDDCYYLSDQVTEEMREKAEGFNNLAKALKNTRIQFLVVALKNDSYRGATIFHYKNGRLITQDFSRPSVSDVENIKDRRDLLWYATDLILDPNTANNYIKLSEGNKKATCVSWQYDLPVHPERFGLTQVLCREGLTGRHYWEVEWSTGYDDVVFIAVAYHGLAKKEGSESEFGKNDKSWSFGRRSNTLQAFHNVEVWADTRPPGQCNRVGVYLDWPAGTLSFYEVCSHKLTHLFTFRTKFAEAVYPGLFVHEYDNYAYLNIAE